MAIPETKARPAVSRILILMTAAAVVGLLVTHFWPRPGLVEVVAIPPDLATPHVAASPAVPAPGPGAQAPAAALPGGGEAPRFDIVHIGPEGRAIIAGRAQPGAEVIVRDGGNEVARARADSGGAFVALVPEPLKPGGQELTLASRSGGAAEVKGDGAVVLVVPEAPKGGRTTEIAPVQAAPPVAVLVPDAAPPRVLQEPAGAKREAVGGLTLDRIDYDEKGAVRFTGGAGSGTTVRVYVDNGVVGDALADAGGRWSLAPSTDVKAGLHSVRVDSLGPGGRVVGRVELPFQRSVMSASDIAAEGERVVVQPGQSLWRLARAAYGRGVQYTVIYLANREQIRDPRLIYPGQTFAVPDAAPARH